MHCIWEVLYRDGRVLNQVDKSAPEFVCVDGDIAGGEVPYRSIDWKNVRTLSFYNLDGVGTSFDIPELPEGYSYSLRKRTFGTLNDDSYACFLLLISAGAPVGDDTVVSSMYWFPDFTVHHCTKFDCADIRKWVSARFSGGAIGLPVLHEELHTDVNAVTI